MLEITPVGQFALSPHLFMQFTEPLSNADSSVDAAWDYLHERWQPDFIRILKELAPPMIRWGGCFASYYHWKEAVGPRSGRVPVVNLFWDGLYSNQAGTAEFVEMCRTVNAEPLMCVNMESDGRRFWARPRPDMDRCGTAEEAAEWVSYCNDPDNLLRRSHGAKEPYHIRYWQVGNETSYPYCAYGSDELIPGGFTLDQAIPVTRKFARAMRGADPDLKLLAWGDSGWAERMCEECGDLIDIIAFHCHMGFRRKSGDSVLTDAYARHSPAAIWEKLMTIPDLLEKRLTEMSEAVRPFGKRLAMTESHCCIEDGRDRGDVLSSWAAGAAYARNLNVIARHGDVLDIATSADFFGNRWQVNAVMLPTPVREFRAYLMPVGQVMKLFSHHTGKFAVPVKCTCGEADVTASMTGNRIFLHIVNPSMDHGADLRFSVKGRKIRSAVMEEISADPQTECSALDREVFEPVRRTLDPDASCRLAPAGVAVIELDTEPAEK